MDPQKPHPSHFLLTVILRVSLGKAWNFYTRSRQSKWITPSVCATAIALLVHATPFPLSPERTATEQVTTGSYTTAFGKHECEKLPDGSEACLNSASEIHYTYTRNARNVVLVRGEVSFDVQPDTTRRFSVLSGHSVIQDISTRFVVYKKSGSTLVTVVEGAIRIYSPVHVASRLNFERGKDPFGSAENGVTASVFHKLQQIELTEATGSLRVLPPLSNRGLSQFLAWREGRIDLNGRRLGDALQQFGRYHVGKFEFADKALSKIRVGGNMDYAHLDDFLQGLQHEFNIHHTMATDADGTPVITLWRPRNRTADDHSTQP
jgi:transmembrane sensor